MDQTSLTDAPGASLVFDLSEKSLATVLTYGEWEEVKNLSWSLARLKVYARHDNLYLAVRDERAFVVSRLELQNWRLTIADLASKLFASADPNYEMLERDKFEASEMMLPHDAVNLLRPTYSVKLRMVHPLNRANALARGKRNKFADAFAPQMRRQWLR